MYQLCHLLRNVEHSNVIFKVDRFEEVGETDAYASQAVNKEHVGPKGKGCQRLPRECVCGRWDTSSP